MDKKKIILIKSVLFAILFCAAFGFIVIGAMYGVALHSDSRQYYDSYMMILLFVAILSGAGFIVCHIKEPEWE